MDYDYLNKQILLLGQELEALVALIINSDEKGNLIDVIDHVNMGLMDCLNINIDEIINIPLDHFIATITIDSQLDHNNLDTLADLFYRIAKVFDAQKEKETSKRLYHRSLKIYLYLAKIEIEFPFERHLRIKELREILLQ